MNRLLLCVGMLWLLAAACVPALSPSDQSGISDEASAIAHCQAEGLACKADGGTGCFSIYDGCMRDAGLR